MAESLLENYNPLYDVHLRQYFALPHMQKHLRRMGLIDSNGKMRDGQDAVYARHNMMMDMMLKNREQQLMKLAELQKKLDAAEKVEIYRRIRSGQSPESFRRTKASRSLSRGRPREGSGPRQRRFSNSFDDKGLIQKIEAKDEPEKINEKDPYARLSAKASKYRYLHKLDDQTLVDYQEQLKRELDRLERFREVSFGVHSVARHAPTSAQSWFFRRRSLPSLTESAPAASLHEPLRSVNSLRGRKVNASPRRGANDSCPPTVRQRRNSNSANPRLPPIQRKHVSKSAAAAPTKSSAKPLKLPPALPRSAPKPSTNTRSAGTKTAKREKLPSLEAVGVGLGRKPSEPKDHSITGAPLASPIPPESEQSEEPRTDDEHCAFYDNGYSIRPESGATGGTSETGGADETEEEEHRMDHTEDERESRERTPEPQDLPTPRSPHHHIVKREVDDEQEGHQHGREEEDQPVEHQYHQQEEDLGHRHEHEEAIEHHHHVHHEHVEDRSDHGQEELIEHHHHHHQLNDQRESEDEHREDHEHVHEPHHDHHDHQDEEPEHHHDHEPHNDHHQDHQDKEPEHHLHSENEPIGQSHEHEDHVIESEEMIHEHHELPRSPSPPVHHEMRDEPEELTYGEHMIHKRVLNEEDHPREEEDETHHSPEPVHHHSPVGSHEGGHDEAEEIHRDHGHILSNHQSHEYEPEGHHELHVDPSHHHQPEEASEDHILSSHHEYEQEGHHQLQADSPSYHHEQEHVLSSHQGYEPEIQEDSHSNDQDHGHILSHDETNDYEHEGHHQLHLEPHQSVHEEREEEHIIPSHEIDEHEQEGHHDHHEHESHQEVSDDHILPSHETHDYGHDHADHEEPRDHVLDSHQTQEYEPEGYDDHRVDELEHREVDEDQDEYEPPISHEAHPDFYNDEPQPIPIGEVIDQAMAEVSHSNIHHEDHHDDHHEERHEDHHSDHHQDHHVDHQEDQHEDQHDEHHHEEHHIERSSPGVVEHDYEPATASPIEVGHVMHESDEHLGPKDDEYEQERALDASEFPDEDQHHHHHSEDQPIIQEAIVESRSYSPVEQGHLEVEPEVADHVERDFNEDFGGHQEETREDIGDHMKPASPSAPSSPAVRHSPDQEDSSAKIDDHVCSILETEQPNDDLSDQEINRSPAELDYSTGIHDDDGDDHGLEDNHDHQHLEDHHQIREDHQSPMSQGNDEDIYRRGMNALGVPEILETAASERGLGSEDNLSTDSMIIHQDQEDKEEEIPIGDHHHDHQDHHEIQDEEKVPTGEGSSDENGNNNGNGSLRGYPEGTKVTEEDYDDENGAHVHKKIIHSEHADDNGHYYSHHESEVQTRLIHAGSKTPASEHPQANESPRMSPTIEQSTL